LTPWRPEADYRTWGRLKTGPHETARPRFADEVAPLISGAAHAPNGLLPAGLARSYAESGVNPGGRVLKLDQLDRFIAFDPETGVMRAEAGLSLNDLLRVTVPKGWFTNTTPGTRFITLGGAVANDVHGKNHHRSGTFGAAVRRMGLLRSDEDGVIELSPQSNTDLFAATIGGLGQTGTIAWVELQLVRIPSSWLAQETVPFGGIADFLTIAAESEESHEFGVSWIDCTAPGGPGFFYRANWSADGDLSVHGEKQKLSLPVDLPSWSLNPLTLTSFNRLYGAAHRMKPASFRIHYSSFFYPLDAIGGWNRLYGKAGFRQYQFVTPPETSADALKAALDVIRRSGEGSFLAVLKTFGKPASPGLLSFPRPGSTLALDFRNRGEDTLRLFDRLDAIVAEAGGRLYPAKDGRMPEALFKAGYPDWAKWAQRRDPAIQSQFVRRILQ